MPQLSAKLTEFGTAQSLRAIASHREETQCSAIDKVVDALPMAYPNRAFRAAIERIVERDADHA